MKVNIWYNLERKIYEVIWKEIYDEMKNIYETKKGI